VETLDLETAMLIMEQLEPVSITNSEGKYIYANKQWLDTFGYTQDVILKLHPWDILPETKVPEVLRTKQPSINHTVQVNGSVGFVSYKPIFKNGVFFGVLIMVIFTGIETALRFSRQITRLSQELERTKMKLRAYSTTHYSIRDIAGESPAIKQLREDIISAARTSSTILIEGETGAGKELVAHSIHDLSSRSALCFMRVNCSAIPEELAESEFFGYAEGAFTGAIKGGKAGRFELANEGSLFLDEINQLSMAIQPKLLRVLQEHEVERIGGKDIIPVNVRIIAASNIPLEEMVKKGTFRSDLFYRLNVIRIHIPPLRERKTDIPLLVRNLLTKLNYQMDMNISHIEDSALEWLMEYDWPGNIRELQNVLESAMNRACGNVLELHHFNVPFQSFVKDNMDKTEKSFLIHPPPTSLLTMKADMEYSAILDAMNRCGGNKTDAANMLGISRNALYKKIRKYDSQNK
jgi:transcriptional regulator with PAS, ATPase and Fis domain